MVDWKALNEKRQKDKECMYIIISGDKGFRRGEFFVTTFGDSISSMNTQDILKIVCDMVLCKAKDNYKELFIVSGDNTGVDDIAIEYAMANNCDVFKYEADWEGQGNKAGFERNERMFIKVGLCEHKGAILFWNGEDYMTRNLIYQAYNYCVPLRVYNYVSKRFLTQQEIIGIQLEEREKQIKFNRH